MFRAHFSAGFMGSVHGMSRRQFLQVGSLGSQGLSLGELLRCECVQGTAHSSKSVIFVFLAGGSSKLDLFDPCPVECGIKDSATVNPSAIQECGSGRLRDRFSTMPTTDQPPDQSRALSTCRIAGGALRGYPALEHCKWTAKASLN